MITFIIVIVNVLADNVVDAFSSRHEVPAADAGRHRAGQGKVGGRTQRTPQGSRQEQDTEQGRAWQFCFVATVTL